MEIPNDVKDKLEDGVCIACCINDVICMTNDYPKSSDVDVLFEIDRKGREIIFRHIIMDDPSNPLTVEYMVDSNFVNNVINSRMIDIFFVNNTFKEEMKIRILFSEDEIKLMKREIGLGT